MKNSIKEYIFTEYNVKYFLYFSKLLESILRHIYLTLLKLNFCSQNRFYNFLFIFIKLFTLSNNN